MSMKRKIIPEFENEEQEAEFWEKHSPLDFIAEPEMQKVRVGGLKDRPIAIRLDSQSRLKLEELAAKQGMGPSTFARYLIQKATEGKATPPKPLDLDVLMKALAQNVTQVHEQKASYRPDIDTGDQAKPSSLVYYGQRKDWEHFSAQLLEQLISVVGVRVVLSGGVKERKA